MALDRHRTRWTVREDRRLCCLCARTGTLAELAAQMGRTPAAVRIRIAKLGLVPAYCKPSFRTLDRAKLDQAVAGGARPADIARKFHVSSGTLIRWRKQLDLPTRSSRFWTADEILSLNKMFPGSTPRQIAVRIERTPAAIAAKARELGLRKPNVHVWAASELRYLKTHYLTTEIKKIAGKLGLSTSAVSAMARRLGLKKWKRLTYEDVKNVREMLGAGIALSEITRRTGFSPATLRSIRSGRRTDARLKPKRLDAAASHHDRYCSAGNAGSREQSTNTDGISSGAARSKQEGV